MYKKIKIVATVFVGLLCSVFSPHVCFAQTWYAYQVSTGGEYNTNPIASPGFDRVEYGISSTVWGGSGATGPGVSASYDNSGTISTILYYEAPMGTDPPDTVTVCEESFAGTEDGWSWAWSLTPGVPSYNWVVNDAFGDPVTVIYNDNPLLDANANIQATSRGLHVNTYKVTVLDKKTPHICPYDKNNYTGMVTIPTRNYTDKTSFTGSGSTNGAMASAGFTENLTADSRSISISSSADPTYNIEDSGFVDEDQNKIYVPELNVRAGGVMNGDIGLNWGDDSYYDYVKVQYTAAPGGNWSTIGSQYTWTSSLKNRTDGPKTLGWVTDTIDPFKQTYNDPELLYPNPNAQPIITDEDANKSDTVKIKYVNGNNSGTPYATPSDGDGATEEASYVMRLHLPSDPPISLNNPPVVRLHLPTPYNQFHYHRASSSGAAPGVAGYNGFTTYVGFQFSDVHDEAGYTIDDGLSLTGIVLGTVGAGTTVAYPEVTACCALAGIGLDTLRTGIKSSGDFGGSWEDCWNNPAISTLNGVPLAAGTAKWVVPDDPWNWTVTPIPYARYADHWMTVFNWGSHGYAGMDTFNYASFDGWVVGGAFVHKCY
jgi:hypothetical protein